MSRRARKRYLSLVLALLSLLVWYGGQRGWFDDAAQQLESAQPGLYRVTRISDGDTIIVDMNGKPETVRFIGVDTPETHKPNTPVQCYGPAASAYTTRKIGSQKVRLVSDSLGTNRDRYDRLLRYVYLADGTFMNIDLIRNGYGFYYPYFPFEKRVEFAAAQAEAQTAHSGLWGNCNPTPTDGGGYISNSAG